LKDLIFHLEFFISCLLHLIWGLFQPNAPSHLSKFKNLYLGILVRKPLFYSSFILYANFLSTTFYTRHYLPFQSFSPLTASSQLLSLSKYQESSEILRTLITAPLYVRGVCSFHNNHSVPNDKSIN